MQELRITSLCDEADLQLRAAFVRKFKLNICIQKWSDDHKEADYQRHDGKAFSDEQREYIHVFMEGWRSCAFVFDRLVKDKNNWVDNPLEGC